MIDYHTHILPGIDDGCQTVEESIKVLNMLKEQGVSTVYATPHFYSGQNNPKVFLSRRERAYERLKPYLTADMPEVILGAEIEFFEGISRVKDIFDLGLGEKKILLIEMPERSWSARVIGEILMLNSNSAYTVMIAHIERYSMYQKKDVLKMLLAEGVLMQGSADFFAYPKTRKKALKMLNNGLIHVLGSDAHNSEARAPRMGEAAQVIKARFGEEFLSSLVL